MCKTCEQLIQLLFDYSFNVFEVYVERFEAYKFPKSKKARSWARHWNENTKVHIMQLLQDYILVPWSLVLDPVVPKGRLPHSLNKNILTI